MFESRRITEVTAKAKKLEKKVIDIERLLAKHDSKLKSMEEKENKLERFSRRNNLRIVGLKEKTGEKPIELVTKIISDYLDIEDPQVERAHRDGKRGGDGRARHMLVKVLRYQDKRTILSQQRHKLDECDYYITDDLAMTFSLPNVQLWI